MIIIPFIFNGKGGSYKSSVFIANLLIKNKFNVKLIIPNSLNRDIIFKSIPSENLIILEIPNSLIEFFYKLPKLLRFPYYIFYILALRNKKIFVNDTIIHVNDDNTIIPFFLLKTLKYRFKLFWHIRQSKSQAFDKVISDKVDLVIANSYYTSKRFNGNEKLRIIQNSLDFNQFEVIGKEFTKIKPLVFGFSSRLVENKRPDLAIKAVVSLLELNFEISLKLIGKSKNDHYLKKLESLIPHKFIDKIKFLGYTNDVSEFYNSIDILIIASSHEPFGLVAIEAAYHNVLVISSKNGGVQEIFDNKEAVFFEADSIVDIINKLSYIVQNRSIIPILTNNAKQKVLKEFSAASFTKKLLKVYSNYI